MKRASVIAAVVVAAALGGGGAVAASAVDSDAKAKTVKVVLNEWKLIPTPVRVPAGKVTFVAHNTGKLEHEFVVMRTSLAPDALPMQGNEAKEIGVKGEIADIAPGQTKRVTLTLKAGKYVLICNIPGHYMAGQRAAFRVA